MVRPSQCTIPEADRNRLLNLFAFLLIPLLVTANSRSSVYLPRAKGRPEYVAHPAGELVCRPFGECEPCPEDEVSCGPLFTLPFTKRLRLSCFPGPSLYQQLARSRLRGLQAFARSVWNSLTD